MATEAASRPRWRVHARRWLLNSALFLLFTLAWSLVTLVASNFLAPDRAEPFSFWIYIWYLLTWLFFPGAVVYLALVELVPTRWSGPKRRISAVLLCPLIPAMAWFYVVAFDDVLTYVVLIFGPMVYGAVVRLRPSTI